MATFLNIVLLIKRVTHLSAFFPEVLELHVKEDIYLETELRHRQENEMKCFFCRSFDVPSHSAGSDEDMSLANRIFDGFNKLEMDPWTDIHYVQLPTANRLL